MTYRWNPESIQMTQREAEEMAPRYEREAWRTWGRMMHAQSPALGGIAAVGLSNSTGATLLAGRTRCAP